MPSHSQISRVSSALVIAPFLLFCSALAPLHAHESAAGHSNAVIHGHLEPHHLDAHEDEGPEFEHHADRVVWLTNAVLHTAAYHGDSTSAFIGARFDGVATASSWSARSFDDVARVYGPLRRDRSFRGPPLFPA